MMTVASTTAESETGPLPVSLRERKKLATRRELRRVALRMIAERGYSNVTVEEIAEEAIVHQSPGEPVVTVLRAVMTNQAKTLVDEFAELGGEPLEWLARMRASRT